MSFDLIGPVRAHVSALGLTVPGSPCVPEVAHKFIDEIGEAAVQLSDHAINRNLVGMLESIACIYWSTSCAAQLCGLDIECAWIEIVRAATDLRGSDNRVTFDENDEVVLPPGWRPPDFAPLLPTLGLADAAELASTLDGAES